MAFRRPRVNVKPNVQATRPSNSNTRPQDTSNEINSSQPQEEQPIQQTEQSVLPPPPPPTIIIGKK